MTELLAVDNFAAIRTADVPRLDEPDFRTALIRAVTEEGKRVAAFFTIGRSPETLLAALLIAPQLKKLQMLTMPVRSSYRALTPEAPAFCRFEQEIFEETGIRPEGHPYLKPVRYTGGVKPGVTDFFTVAGEAVHEVAVGPVHAGVIEPGHFRFQCLGEEVLSLEIALGYQHRGVEKMLIGGPDARTLHLIETAAGDTSAAAAINYCGLLESLTGTALPPRAAALRKLALELERIANHIGDLGALAGDVAYLPTASFCGRIRGDFLNLTAKLCGNRFGRGLVVPGGVRYDLTEAGAAEMLAKVTAGEKDLRQALELMFDDPGVLDRLENTGTVDRETAAAIGMTGVAGRASGLAADVRADLSTGNFVPAVAEGGDVLARAQVRRLELTASLAKVKQLLTALPSGTIQQPVTAPLPPEYLAIAVTEAWRGELCHVLRTDADGRIAQLKIVDPSFHNWTGLALALRGQQISDFPICNKSFNLSYCGHDL